MIKEEVPVDPVIITKFDYTDYGVISPVKKEKKYIKQKRQRESKKIIKLDDEGYFNEERPNRFANNLRIELAESVTIIAFGSFFFQRYKGL